MKAGREAEARSTPPRPEHDAALQRARQAGADRRARLSLVLGVLAGLGALTSIPAAIVGLGALRRASPGGRRAAWAGVALGVGWALAWTVGVVTLLVLATQGYYEWLHNPDATNLPGPLFLGP